MGGNNHPNNFFFTEILMEYFMVVVVDKTIQAAFLSDTIPNLFYFRCTLCYQSMKNVLCSSHLCIITTSVYPMLMINKFCTYTTYNRFIIRILWERTPDDFKP